MTDGDIQLQGKVMAMEVVLSVLVARIARGDREMVRRLHSTLAGEVESALQSMRHKERLENAVTNTMEVSGIQALDEIFRMADGLTRGYPGDEAMGCAPG